MFGHLKTAYTKIKTKSCYSLRSKLLSKDIVNNMVNTPAKLNHELE